MRQECTQFVLIGSGFIAFVGKAGGADIGTRKNRPY